jgi:hypothetical protein
VGQRHLARHRHVSPTNQSCIRDGVVGARHGWVVTSAVRAPVLPATLWMLVVSMASARLFGGRMVGQYHPNGKWLPVIQLLYATENLSMSDITGSRAACGE